MDYNFIIGLMLVLSLVLGFLYVRRMFFDYIRFEWEQGHVKIGLPPVGCGDKVTVLPEKIIPVVAAWFLTEAERQRLAEISKKDARRFKEEKENTEQSSEV